MENYTNYVPILICPVSILFEFENLIASFSSHRGLLFLNLVQILTYIVELRSKLLYIIAFIIMGSTFKIVRTSFNY